MQATSNAHSPLGNVITIALFELKKVFHTRRGIAAIIAFALVWGFILLYPIRSASEYMLSHEFRGFIASIVGENSVDQLFQWPVAELALLWVIGLYIFPLFSIFIAADQFASDKARGFFRFITLRTARSSLFYGRFIGHLTIQLCLILLVVAATIGLACLRQPELLTQALIDGAIVIANLLIILLPFTALMAMLSLHATTARQATVQAIIFWALTSIAMAIIKSYAPEFSFIEWSLPGAQLSAMVNTYGSTSFEYSIVPLVQAAVLLLIGQFYMKKVAL